MSAVQRVVDGENAVMIGVGHKDAFRREDGLALLIGDRDKDRFGLHDIGDKDRLDQRLACDRRADQMRTVVDEKIVEENLKAINAKLETAIWQESTLFTGLLGVIAADASAGIKTYDASAGVDYSEVIDKAYGEITDSMYERGEVTMFVSPTVYRGYISELNAVCCANREVIDVASETINYPGDSRITIRPTVGLTGAEISSKDVYVVCTWAKNLVFGTDVENSENDFKVWYDDKDEMTRFKVLFNAGTQVKFPDEVITITEA